MKFYLTILSAFLTSLTYSQSLIPNGNFESTSIVKSNYNLINPLSGDTTFISTARCLNYDFEDTGYIIDTNQFAIEDWIEFNGVEQSVICTPKNSEVQKDNQVSYYFSPFVVSDFTSSYISNNLNSTLSRGESYTLTFSIRQNNLYPEDPYGLKNLQLQFLNDDKEAKVINLADSVYQFNQDNWTNVSYTFKASGDENKIRLGHISPYNKNPDSVTTEYWSLCKKLKKMKYGSIKYQSTTKKIKALFPHLHIEINETNFKELPQSFIGIGYVIDDVELILN